MTLSVFKSDLLSITRAEFIQFNALISGFNKGNLTMFLFIYLFFKSLTDLLGPFDHPYPFINSQVSTIIYSNSSNLPNSQFLISNSLKFSISKI